MTVLLMLQKIEDSPAAYYQPTIRDVLGLLAMDDECIGGDGNFLIMRAPDGHTRRVLDMLGGYGGNLLGHNHPAIVACLRECIDSGIPNNAQATHRGAAEKLAKRLSTLLEEETGKGPWVTSLANSGTEAVEAAIKLALMRFHQRCQNVRRQTNAQTHLVCQLVNSGLEPSRAQQNAYELWQSLPPEEQARLRVQVDTEQGKSELPQAIFQWFVAERQRLATLLQPRILCLERSFHGKTLGALPLLDNSLLRVPFGSEAAFSVTRLSPSTDDPGAVVARHAIESFAIDISGDRVAFRPTRCHSVAAIIVEPIQGEGGIRPVPPRSVRAMRQACDEAEALFISDEVQSGLYRTGLLAALHHADCVADVYCFAKSLGGGFAKVAATVCLAGEYPETFDVLHTSTFAGDHLSSTLAHHVLNIVYDERRRARQHTLREQVTHLAQEFPDIIADVRGAGLMVGVELKAELADRCYEFRTFSFAGYFGHLCAAALLSNENIRTGSSLSDSFTLRLEPSIFTDEDEVALFIAGLRRFCLAARHLDIAYFVRPLFPKAAVKPTREISKRRTTSEPMAVFFCHPIDTRQVKASFPSLCAAEPDELEIISRKLGKGAPFIPYDQCRLRGRTSTIDVLIMTHPYTTVHFAEILKSGARHKMVEKLQTAIRQVREWGATTIGLGQFTSIISNNGLDLDPMGLNLTTGNAYTVALTVRAVFTSCLMAGRPPLSQARVGCVGAAGNIVATTAQFLAEHCQSMHFVHHTPLAESPKYQNKMRAFFAEALRPNATARGPLVEAIQYVARALSYDNTLAGVLKLAAALHKEGICQFRHDLETIGECDIVVAGASSHQPFIADRLFKEGCIAVDVGVPANIIRSDDRADICYVKGGLAHLPRAAGDEGQQSVLDLPILGLKPGTSYACLAETMALTLAGVKDFYAVGSLSKSLVERVAAIAEGEGFGLSHPDAAGVRV